jgi:hypothetical protein
MEASEAVANATILLAWHLRRAGEDDRVLELMERLVERYGQPGVAGYRPTAPIANDGIAWIIDEAGRADEAIHIYDGVIQDLRDTSEPELRIHLARALTRKASLLSDKSLLEDRDAICEEVVGRFAGTQDPKIAENVAWAQTVLDEYSRRPRRRRRRKWR